MFYVLIKTVKIIWNSFIFRFNKHCWKVISLNTACVKVSFLLQWWWLILIDPAHLMLQGTWNRKPSLNVFSEPGQSTQRGFSNRAHFFTQRLENVRDREKINILLHSFSLIIFFYFWCDYKPWGILIFISNRQVFSYSLPLNHSFSQRCTIFSSPVLSLQQCTTLSLSGCLLQVRTCKHYSYNPCNAEMWQAQCRWQL